MKNLTLGIESSCDETAAAVVRSDGLVLSSVLASQAEVFAELGGVIPELAARAHTEKVIPVIEQALEQAGVGWNAIDQLAVTEGPGLIGALLVGHAAARALSFSREKPLVWVNHLRAHVLASWLYHAEETPPEIAYPALGLLVSGGHTELIWLPEPGAWEVVGATRDDAAGEAFDKVARLLGLAYPGGPEISRAAEQGDPQRFDLPRPLTDQDSLEMSFSGLKSAVRRIVQGFQQNEAPPRSSSRDAMHGVSTSAQDRFIKDLAASFQEAVVETLVQKTVRAVEQYQPASVILAGGVAANRSLRNRLAERFGERFFAPKLSYCMDNAAMIAYAANQPQIA